MKSKHSCKSWEWQIAFSSGISPLLGSWATLFNSLIGPARWTPVSILFLVLQAQSSLFLEQVSRFLYRLRPLSGVFFLIRMAVHLFINKPYPQSHPYLLYFILCWFWYFIWNYFLLWFTYLSLSWTPECKRHDD